MRGLIYSTAKTQTPAQRCTEAVLRAFGIYGVRPESLIDLLRHLNTSGRKVEQINAQGYSLWSFRATHPTGNYVIITSGHAIALIDGRLTDTASKSGGTRVLQAFRVTKGE